MADLRVMTYNLYLGADLALLFAATSLEELTSLAGVVRGQLEATDFSARAAAVARIVAREQPDVIGLQEVTRWTTGVPGPEEQVIEDFLPVLLSALEAVGCPCDVHAVDVNFAGGLPVGQEWMGIVGANVTLVRRGGRYVVTGESTATYSASLEQPTGLDGVAFPIVRGLGLVEGTVGDRPVVVVNTHTEAYDADVRDAQRDELLAHVAAEAVPVVLLGDFNARPDELGVPEPWVDAWAAAGDRADPGYTCGQAAGLANQQSMLGERIDYVLVRGARVSACRVVGGEPADRTPSGLWPSDHAGVVADLVL